MTPLVTLRLFVRLYHGGIGNGNMRNMSLGLGLMIGGWNTGSAKTTSLSLALR
ncbi:hypothetical protein D3C76_1780100 [compost metagenome]